MTPDDPAPGPGPEPGDPEPDPFETGEFEAQFDSTDLPDLDAPNLDGPDVEHGEPDDVPFDPATFDFSTFDPATFDPATFDFSKLDFSKLDFSALDLSSLGIPGLEPGTFPVAGLDLSALTGMDPAALARMLGSSGPLNWDVATQIATVVATGGTPEPDIDEANRLRLEELVHAAQTHVVAETGLAATFATPLRVVNRADWARLHLDALRPVLEALATTLGQAFQVGAAPSDDEASSPGADPMAALLPALGPVLLGVQAGSMIGYLAQHALGRYDLPLPTSDAPSLCLVVRNLEEFERSWSLDPDDLRFYVAIHEVVHAAMRSVGWVRERLVSLAVEYVSAYETNETILEARFAGLDPTDPEAMRRLAEHPEEILDAMRSEAQRQVLERARTFQAVLEGYADVVLERIGQRLITSFGRIHEAMARHRIERGDAERFVGGLLGLAADREDYEMGASFARGVVERADADGLNRLWESVEMVPTPNELRAPGLWLARIDLDLDES